MNHVAGIRIAHVHVPDRGVRIHRQEPTEGPIEWEKVRRIAGLKLRVGRGASGLEYVARQNGEWRISVRGRRRETEIGGARMQDHALQLAMMWEQAVLSGRIDMGL